MLFLSKSVQSSSGRFLGETRKARKNGEPGYEFVERIEDHKVGHFSFQNMLVFRLLLTRRLTLVEIFMTVVMYWSQQHGWRGQIIDTRKPERGIVLT